jgi:hypothetical protein
MEQKIHINHSLHAWPTYTAKCLLTFAVFVLSISFIQAQTLKDSIPEKYLPDSNYYKVYRGFLTGRVYTGYKYAKLRLAPGNTEGPEMNYRPNSNITLGIGATYNWLTVNVSYGFKFLNEYDKDKGETKSLELQTHLYGRRSLIDFYGQFYKGYYLTTNNGGSESYYVRPDMGTALIGLHYEYMTNWRKFSMRAAMLQSERQLRSAGTPFLGFSIQYSQAKADSSFVPTMPAYAMLPDITQISSFEFGPSAGYGYTLILLKRLFFTGTFKAQLNLNFATGKYLDESRHHVTIRPDYGFRFAFGYNRPLWSISGIWINQNAGGDAENFKYQFTSGMARISAVYRFIPGKKTQHFLRPIDVVEEKYVRKLIAKLNSLKPGQ